MHPPSGSTASASSAWEAEAEQGRFRAGTLLAGIRRMELGAAPQASPRQPAAVFTLEDADAASTAADDPRPLARCPAAGPATGPGVATTATATTAATATVAAAAAAPDFLTLNPFTRRGTVAAAPALPPATRQAQLPQPPPPSFAAAQPPLPQQRAVPLAMPAAASALHTFASWPGLEPDPDWFRAFASQETPSPAPTGTPSQPPQPPQLAVPLFTPQLAMPAAASALPRFTSRQVTQVHTWVSELLQKYYLQETVIGAGVEGDVTLVPELNSEGSQLRGKPVIRETHQTLGLPEEGRGRVNIHLRGEELEHAVGYGMRYGLRMRGKRSGTSSEAGVHLWPPAPLYIIDMVHGGELAAPAGPSTHARGFGCFVLV